VHVQDDRYRYKSLHVGSDADPCTIGFDTEAYGPLDANLAAGDSPGGSMSIKVTGRSRRSATEVGFGKHTRLPGKSVAGAVAPGPRHGDFVVPG